MQARRKNMARMSELVPDSGEQALQHFLSNSPWDERAVLDQVAQEADARLGGSEDSALLIDESGIAKKGRTPVGVSRQWNGRLGEGGQLPGGRVCGAEPRAPEHAGGHAAVSAGRMGVGSRALRGGGGTEE